MLVFVSIIKLVAEIALMALVGQGALAVLAGTRRNENIFYRLLQVLTRPFIAGVRFVAPRVVLDRHVPFVAFLLLLFVWVTATLTKISICVEIGVELCK